MATVAAWHELVGTLPGLVEVERGLVRGPATAPGVLLLDAVERVGRPSQSGLTRDLGLTGLTDERSSPCSTPPAASHPYEPPPAGQTTTPKEP